MHGIPKAFSALSSLLKRLPYGLRLDDSNLADTAHVVKLTGGGWTIDGGPQDFAALQVWGKVWGKPSPNYARGDILASELVPTSLPSGVYSSLPLLRQYANGNL
jgi:hypothetical protein